LIFLAGCDHARENPPGYSQGISIEYLDWIDKGPKGTSLEYFQSDVIKKNAVRECKIYEQHAESDPRISKELHFSLDGNLVRVTNNYFSDWEHGTDRGTYVYLYDDNKRLREWKGLSTEDGKDSVRTVLTYLPSGLVLSRDTYEFSKKLKPGADHHLPKPDDFERVPTWALTRSLKFWSDSTRVLVRTVEDKGSVNTDEYQFKFDSLSSIKVIRKIENRLIETRSYSYQKYTIQETVIRESKDEEKLIFHIKAKLDLNGNVIERANLNANRDISSTLTIAYNQEGTIAAIKRGDTVQRFEYEHY
jgi:hypothetical protein